MSKQRGTSGGSAAVVKDQDLRALAELFALLADKTRLRILMAIRTDERNVSDLCDELKMRQPSVSHHLGLLRMCRLVRTRRDGKQIFYSLNDHVEPIADRGLQVRVGHFEMRLAAR